MGNNSKNVLLKRISAILFAVSLAAYALPFVKIIGGIDKLVEVATGFISSLFGGGIGAEEAEAVTYKGYDLFMGVFSSGSGLNELSTSTQLSVVFIAIVALAAAGIVFGFVPALKKLARVLMPIFGIADAVMLLIVVSLLNSGLKIGGGGEGGILGNIVDTALGFVGAEGTAEVQIGFWVSFGAVVAAAVVAFLALKAYSGEGVYIGESEGEASIVGISGMYKGFSFPIASDEELILGRDAMLSHIVITENAEKISRKHLTVSFDSYDNVYMVTDHSSNGTYLADGTRLVANIPVKLQRGTVIYLAKKENSFKLT